MKRECVSSIAIIAAIIQSTTLLVTRSLKKIGSLLTFNYGPTKVYSTLKGQTIKQNTSKMSPLKLRMNFCR